LAEHIARRSAEHIARIEAVVPHPGLAGVAKRLQFVMYDVPGLSSLPVRENKNVTVCCVLIVASFCLFRFTASKNYDVEDRSCRCQRKEEG
jgi:hypothetical protein